MALRDILAKFDIDTSGLAGKAKGADSAVSGLAAKISSVGGLLTGAAIVTGIKGFVDGMIESASALDDASQQLGISAQALQQWQFAAKLCGAEATDLNTALKILQKNAASAGANGAESGGRFKELGVAIRDGAGNMRQTTDILYDTGIAISKMSSPADRTAAALEVFGKAGTKLLPMFANGEAGLQDLLAEVERLGGGLSDEAIAGMAQLGDDTDRATMAFTSFKSKLAVAVLPTLMKLVDWGTKAISFLSKATEGTNVFKAALIVLGTAGAAAGVKMLLPYLPMIAGFAFLILAVDELITTLEGGDSLINRFLGKTAGRNDIFGDMAKDSQALIKSMQKQPGVWAKIEEAFSVVGAGIVRFFVDTLPEAASYAWNDLKMWIYGIGVDIGLWIASLPGVVSGAFQAMIGGLTGNLEVFYQGAINIGKEIIRGILDGLESAGDAVVDKIKDVTGIGTTQAEGDAMLKAFTAIEMAKVQSTALSPTAPVGAPQRVENKNSVAATNQFSITVEKVEDEESMKAALVLGMGEANRAALSALVTIATGGQRG